MPAVAGQVPEIISAEYVRNILDYNPDTGIFIWKYRTDVSNRWNTKYVGKRAGWKDSKGAYVLTINDKYYKAHRIAWLYMTGEWPKEEIDHRDLNGMNNKWENLREATHSQNQFNKRAQSNNKSGYKGVHWDKYKEKWVAAIGINNKSIYLGRFRSKEDAYMAYCDAANKLHGEFARVA